VGICGILVYSEFKSLIYVAVPVLSAFIWNLSRDCAETILNIFPLQLLANGTPTPSQIVEYLLSSTNEFPWIIADVTGDIKDFSLSKLGSRILLPSETLIQIVAFVKMGTPLYVSGVIFLAAEASDFGFPSINVLLVVSIGLSVFEIFRAMSFGVMDFGYGQLFSYVLEINVEPAISHYFQYFYQPSRLVEHARSLVYSKVGSVVHIGLRNMYSYLPKRWKAEWIDHYLQVDDHNITPPKPVEKSSPKIPLAALDVPVIPNVVNQQLLPASPQVPVEAGQQPSGDISLFNRPLFLINVYHILIQIFSLGHSYCYF